MIVYIVLRKSYENDFEAIIEGVFENYLDAFDAKIRNESRGLGNDYLFEVEEWEVE